MIIASFHCLRQLKITNLKANKHFKSGNKFYTEEKYKKAIAEYEAALQLNPNLKAAFYYLGSSYIMVYKPGDDSEKNKEFGIKATENLQKALELDPENKNIIQALGDINDKMRNFELAEKYYLQVQKFTPNDPASYYNLAGFYNNNAKYDKAIEMYEQRIALDPANPEGYLYLAGFFQNKRKWDDAIKNHEMRIEKIAATPTWTKRKRTNSWPMPIIAWASSAGTRAIRPRPTSWVRSSACRWSKRVSKALKKATDMSPNFPDPWAYMGLLYRQKTIAEPLKKAEYDKEYERHDPEIPGTPQTQTGYRAIHQRTVQG